MKPQPSTVFHVESIPQAMLSVQRWLNWRAVRRDGKWTKVPVDPNTGGSGDSTNSSKWGSLDVAVHRATADPTLGLGLGFALGDGWLGVDLDHVVDEASGKIIDDDVSKWIDSHETYVETTPSGTGLHAIFFNVAKPEWSQNRREPVEVYDDKRFFTVTGLARFRDREIVADQTAVDSLCDKYLRKDKPTSPTGAERTRNPDNSADDFAFACDLVRASTPRPEIEAKLVAKMIAEGRVDKANRPDYVGRTIDRAEQRIEANPPKPNTADKLVTLALDRFELGRTSKGETFAVEKTGASVALRLEGSAMKATLASLYYEEHARVAGSAAIEESLAVLRGKAMKTESKELAIRYGRHGDAIVLDLGRVDGEAVEIDRNGWRMVKRSPILFERTALVGELPVPIDGGDVSELRGLLNVDEDDFDVLVGWMIAAMIPEIAHPILMLGGGQGTGKTTAATMIVGVLDASDAPTRTQPREPETYALTIAAAWTTVFDNVSKIPEWLSDALCKTVTGDAFTRRTHYSNREITVVSFRRVVVITSIDAGALRGDLADRLVLVELNKIDKVRSETEIVNRHGEMCPRLLGAFCTLLASTLARLSGVDLKSFRMADFARVLAAVDAVRGTGSLATYLGQGEGLADDVVESDVVGTAIRAFMATRTRWAGTMKELLAAILPADAGRDFPKTPKGLGSRSRRLAPALEKLGILVTSPSRKNKTRIYTLETAQTAQPPDSRAHSVETSFANQAVSF